LQGKTVLFQPLEIPMKLSHLIILLVMNLCWAGVYSANMVLGHDLTTGGIVTIRFGLAGLCLLVAWPWLPGSAPRGRDLVKSCVMGFILLVLGQRLQVYGNELGTAGNSAVLMAVEPLITSLAAALFLREHIGPRRLAGFGLGMCGVVLLNGVWRKDFQWTGLVPSLIFISSFVCEAAYSVMGKPIVARASVMKMLAISLLFGTAANLLIDGPATLKAAQTLPAQAWFLLLALAVVCTAIGYSVWFIVIRECPVNVAALTIFVQSVFGVAIAALWLGEKLHWGQLLGSITIVAGLVLGLSRQIQRPAHGGSTLVEPSA
jgi:drug/metabolite transporter (DMT)-like permease